MMNTKIFIGNLSFRTSKEALQETFSKFGNIVDVFIPTNRETGRPRGFAFVEFDTQESAQNACSFDGQELDGKNIVVNMAKSDRDRTRGGSGGGAGGSRGAGGGSSRGGYAGGGGGGGRSSY